MGNNNKEGVKTDLNDKGTACPTLKMDNSNNMYTNFSNVIDGKKDLY